RKAMKETDPSKKAALIQAIEEDGLLLQQKYQKKKELSDKFNFDPKRKVDDLIEAMKKAIERGEKRKPDGSGGGGHKEPNISDNDSSDSDNESSDDDDNGNSKKKREKDPKNDFFQDNKQLIIISSNPIITTSNMTNPEEIKSKLGEFTEKVEEGIGTTFIVGHSLYGELEP
ncbi:9272_t:CDS:2, partial [Ambispora gerdemannii]